jgi:hypothetical protein
MSKKSKQLSSPWWSDVSLSAYLHLFGAAEKEEQEWVAIPPDPLYPQKAVGWRLYQHIQDRWVLIALGHQLTIKELVEGANINGTPKKPIPVHNPNAPLLPSQMK